MLKTFISMLVLLFMLFISSCWRKLEMQGCNNVGNIADDTTSSSWSG